MREKLAILAVLGSVAAVPVLFGWYALDHRPSTYPPEACVLDLTGFAGRGVWTLERVHGLNAWWKAFEPATMHLRLGAHVVLRLHSADVLHQFYVPALGIGPVDVYPGHVTEVRFSAGQEGVFQYYCTSLCGECHFYMSGWIVVTGPGRPPPRPKPIVCTLCLPEAPPPAEEGHIAQGEYLYRRSACEACHGVEGRGGVTNYNYVQGQIVDHVHLAERLFLRDAASAELLVDWLSRPPHGESPEREPELTGLGIVKARLEAAMTLIRDGKNAARADVDGPSPPLQMPAWKYRLTDPEIRSILAYLISLNPWDEDETEAERSVTLNR